MSRLSGWKGRDCRRKGAIKKKGGGKQYSTEVCFRAKEGDREAKDIVRIGKGIKMKALLIGYGEVGQGIYEAWKEYHDIHIYDADPAKEFLQLPASVDIILLSIPYSDEFVNCASQYKRMMDDSPMIVFSSVPIGTCNKIPAVHSPIEGNHGSPAAMADAIRKHKRYIGGFSKTAYSFFEQAKCDVIYCEKPEHTEFLKLRSTTIYGINIEFARYSKEVANKIGLDYEGIKKYDEDYNELVRETGRSNLQRYVLDAPEGKIGGHCIIPNARLLEDTEFDHSFIKYVRDKNVVLKG